MTSAPLATRLLLLTLVAPALGAQTIATTSEADPRVGLKPGAATRFRGQVS